MGRERSFSLLYTAFNYFKDTYTLARRLLQRAHLCTYLMTESSQEPFIFKCQSLTNNVPSAGPYHCVRNVRTRSYSGPHFPAFELNTERCSVSLRIQLECGKIRTRITPDTDTFHAVYFPLR